MGPAAFILHRVLFLQVDGVSYLLQEIYGIENKYNSQESKVNIRHHRKDFSVCFSSSASETTWRWGKIKQSLRNSVVFLSPGCWRWDQWQQCWMCGVFIGCARHPHSAVQTPVSLQRLRRHSALPGQLLPHLQTAWVPINHEEFPSKMRCWKSGSLCWKRLLKLVKAKENLKKWPLQLTDHCNRGNCV